MSIAKGWKESFSVGSGTLLDGRIAFCLTRKASLRSSRRPAAGFWWLGGRAQLRQKHRNYPMDPYRRQPRGIVAPLPGQPTIRYMRPRQPQLGEGSQNQPRPPVGLLGVAHAGGVPSEGLLEEAEGVLQVKASDVSFPEQAEIRSHSLWAGPPQPQLLRLAPPLTSGQPFDLHQNERTNHDRQGSAAAPAFVRPDFGVHLLPSSHAHSTVAGVLAFVLYGGFGPGLWIGALHLRSVAAWPSGVGGRLGEARIGVEAAARSQADKDLAWTSFQPLLELHGVVAGVEDEKRHVCRTALHCGSSEQPLDLLGGGHVHLPVRMDTLCIYRSRPTLAHEAQLRYELVGPSSHDRLSGGVARRMVIVAALRAALRIATGPDTYVHGVDR